MPKRKDTTAPTNLHMALLNGVALVTAAKFVKWLNSEKLTGGDLLASVGEGGVIDVTSKELAEACGYNRLTNYHLELIDKLVEMQLVTTGYMKGGRRVFKLTESGYKWTIGRF